MVDDSDGDDGGYGHVVPQQVAGRQIGGALMLQAPRRRSEPDAILAKLEQVDSRLEANVSGFMPT